jgi:hypothetical protein
MMRVLYMMFFLLALITLGGDLYASLSADGVIRLGALGEWWATIHRDSLLLISARQFGIRVSRRCWNGPRL